MLTITERLLKLIREVTRMENEMTPEQTIKRHILINMLTEEQMDNDDDLDLSTANGIDAAYNLAEEYIGVFSETEIIDEVSEFRCSGIDTDIKCEYSRHYESKSVAREIDGKWVGWTYWYGGGKHGEPEVIDWMDEAPMAYKNIFDVMDLQEELVDIVAHIKPIINIKG